MTSWPTPATIADAVLEGTVVGSFTKIGFAARSRLENWDDPAIDLTGQTAVVTGSTSGIGRATAGGLMALGATVIVTSRSAERAETAASELNAGGHTGSAQGLPLDTSDFDSIAGFTDSITSVSPNVDMLVHNAGALTNTYKTDNRGMELTLSAHLVGPYLLTKKLEPLLVEGARVIVMSSGGMYTQRLDVGSLEMSEADFKGAVAYAKAKRGQVETITHLGPQLAPRIILHAMHPGWVDTPGVDAGLPGFGKLMGPLLRTADQGADTMVWLAATGAPDHPPGQFWLDRKPRRSAYIPGTSTTRAERERLIAWLDEQVAPAL